MSGFDKSQKISVINVLRQLTGLDLAGARRMAEQTETGNEIAVVNEISSNEAQRARLALTDAGAHVVVRSKDSPNEEMPEDRPIAGECSRDGLLDRRLGSASGDAETTLKLIQENLEISELSEWVGNATIIDLGTWSEGWVVLTNSRI